MSDPLSKLAGELLSRDPGEREEAARGLTELGDPRAGPHLARALKDPEEAVRIWGAYGLGKLRRPEDAPALRRALAQDRSATVRLWAAFGMVARGERAESATLLSFLDDASLDVRNNAADALLSLESPELVRAPLERRLASSDERTRAWAAGVLHRQGHPKAFGVWRAALASAEARIDAAMVAHHLGEGPAARELLAALCQVPRGELEAPVPSAGGLPAAEVLSAPLLELGLAALLATAKRDGPLRTLLVWLLGRGLSADPEVLGQVHQCLAGLDPGLVSANLAALLTRTPGAERALLVARFATFLSEPVLPALGALEKAAREAIVGRALQATADGGDSSFEFAPLADLLRASPWASLLGRPLEAAPPPGEGEEPETQPGVTAVDVPVTPAPPPKARRPTRTDVTVAVVGPTTAAQAASRALCVAAVLHRWLLEQALASEDLNLDEAQESAFELSRWVDTERLNRELSPVEAAWLGTEPGGWSDEDRVQASWAAEALGMLLWALRAAEPPAADAPADLPALLERLPLLATIGGFVSGAKLRPAAELSAQRELWEQWRFRARAEVAARNDGGPREGSLSAAASLCEQGLLPRTVAGDFPYRGKAFSKIDEADLAAALRISLERHRALHWVSLGGEWDQVASERG